MEEKLRERDVLSIDAEKYIENHNNVLFQGGKLATTTSHIVDRFNEVTAQVNNFNAAISRASIRSILLTQLSLTYTNAENILNNMRQNLDSLVRHQISSNLIPPETLVNVLATIRNS